MMLAGVRDASCEMHGLGAAIAGAPAGEQTTHHAATAAGSHETGDGEHRRAPAGCDCTCVGACTISAPLATPPSVATLRVALVEPEPRVSIGVEPSLVPPRAPDRLLPFANGPPTATV